MTVEKPILLPTASAGGDNAFYLDKCDVVENRPSYAACIHKITQRKEGKLDRVFSACSTAINRGDCRAVGMREKELLEGKAIYFVSRAEIRAATDAKEALLATLPRTGFESAPTRKGGRGINRTEKVAQKPDTQAGFVVQKTDYAAAINAAMRDPEPKPQPIKMALITMLPGESVRDYAARVMASKKENVTQ